MLSWFKSRASPETSKLNPGKSVEISVGFSNGNRSWSEKLNILTCMADILGSGNYSYAVKKSWIELDSDFIIQPRFLWLKPLEKGGVQTVTTIEVSHPSGIPPGIFEFQHATGDNVHQSIAKGIEGWMRLDLPVFFDAVEKRPKHCTLLQFDLPPEGTTPRRKRRVVLGPISHLVTKPEGSGKEEHPFCPCCLFTNTLTVMKSRVFDDNFYGLRLFAMREGNGSHSADCRLNGEDWESGKTALVEYVNSWPDRGVEFRKQFVIVQNEPER
jgi:hypothetical protein